MNVTGEFDARPKVTQGQVVPWEKGHKDDPGWLEACLIVVEHVYHGLQFTFCIVFT